MTTRNLLIYIEKKWIGSRNKALAEAKRQALQMAQEDLTGDQLPIEIPRVRFTGGTHHSVNDWAFEFSYDAPDTTTAFDPDGDVAFQAEDPS